MTNTLLEFKQNLRKAPPETETRKKNSFSMGFLWSVPRNAILIQFNKSSHDCGQPPVMTVTSWTEEEGRVMRSQSEALLVGKAPRRTG